jgi:hypothetical protein
MKNAPATRMAIAAEFRLGIATAPKDSKSVSTSQGKFRLAAKYLSSATAAN